MTSATIEKGTLIDHCLHTDCQQNIPYVGVCTVLGSAWMIILDHSLIWAHYVLPSVQTPLVKVAAREFVELPLTDKALGKRLTEAIER